MFLFSILKFDVFSDIIEIEINSIIELRTYYEKLNLSKSATFIDFDETIARSVGCFMDKKYQFLASPDLFRTYESVSKEASVFFSFDNYQTLQVERVLMEGEETKIVVHELIDRSAFVSVLSALFADLSKLSFLATHWGKGNNDFESKLSYNYGGDKARRALQLVLQQFNKNDPIDNIVLIDNSNEFTLQPFKDNLTQYIEEEILINPENEWLKNINIVLIHYKYFGNELTIEKLKAEYDGFQHDVKTFKEKAQQLVSNRLGRG